MWLTLFYQKLQTVDNNEKGQNSSKDFEKIITNNQNEKGDENDNQIRAQYQNILCEYKCLICNLKSFPTQEKLNRHNSTIHEVNSENRHFKCEHCNNFFSREDSLNRHEFSRCLKRKSIQDNIAPRFSFDKNNIWFSRSIPKLFNF